MLPSMARRKQNRPTYTVNQVIASNVAKARMLRGWTQQEAADALAPYLGTKMSTASFSAMPISCQIPQLIATTRCSGRSADCASALR